MSNEIVIALVGVLCTALSGWFSHLWTMRKYTVEVDSQQIKNVEDSFELYKKIMTDAIKSQDDKIAALQKENDSLRDQVNQLQRMMIDLVGNIHANPAIPTAPISLDTIDRLNATYGNKQ